MNRNRFGSYLESMKLAKMLLAQAQDKFNHKDDRAAIRDTIRAVQSFITSMNNIASLAFEPRKKHRLSKKKRMPRAIKKLVESQVNIPTLYSKVLNDNQRDLLA